MATIPVFTPAGERAGEIELAADVFGITPNEALMHQSVVAALANQRQGTADTKTRGEVHHSTKKIYRQKGTGRARQGMRSAPHWKGGGIVFGPHPRDYSVSFPKKMRRKALLSALSAKAEAEAIVVVESFGITEPKTKAATALLSALGLTEKKVLLVLEDRIDDQPTERNMRLSCEMLAFRNLPKVYAVPVSLLGTVDVLHADCLLFSRAALESLQALKQQPLGIARWIAKQQGGVE